MANLYTNYKANLSTTALTTVYTVATSTTEIYIVPEQLHGKGKGIRNMNLDGTGVALGFVFRFSA